MCKQFKVLSSALRSLLSSNQGTAADGSQVPTRDQIPAEYKWHLDDLYKSDEAWQEDYDKVKGMLFSAVVQYKGKLDYSGKELFYCLQLRDEITMLTSKLSSFAMMHKDEDSSVNKYQALDGKAQSLATEASAAVSFIEPEILGIPVEKLQQFRQEVTELTIYSFYFDNLLLQKQHILTQKEEELLSRAGDMAATPATVFDVLSTTELKFPQIIDETGEEVELSEGRFYGFLRSSDRCVRQDAFTGILGTYSKYRNTLAATLNGHVKQHMFFSNARKYHSAQEYALAPNYIPVEVYDNLIKTVNNNLAPLHRYVALKKKALEVDEIHMYDLYVPMVADKEIKVTYEEALDLVRKGLAPLGTEYMDNFNRGVSSGWIDVYENQGKKSGAYSQGIYGAHPYVLLNYNGQYDDASTLAHEMGHAMHSFYSASNQPYATSEYAIFTAETASTTNEILLIDYMLQKTTDKKEKLFLLTQYLEGIRTTLYRQTMFAEFEKIIHEKGEKNETLTADSLEAIYHDLNVKYYGPDMIVDKEIDIEWARIPHFYYNFYVYQYSTGYSAATAFAQQLQVEGKPAQERYISNFLKAGGSDTPINILKRAGVDMSTPAPIEITLQKFNKLLDEAEALLTEDDC